MTAVTGRGSRVAILGATGPTGRQLARELGGRGMTVRAVSRSAANLARVFAATAVEQHAADMLDAKATLAAIESAELVVDCIGAPIARIEDHPATARSIAAAIRATGARAVQVSSWWAYVPIRRLPLDESQPRPAGNRLARARREGEDVLADAGAAIAHLPDFFGPEVQASVLQQALAAAADGKPVSWIGRPDTQREYGFVPDAMRMVADLAGHADAFGRHWIVPGAGPITGRAIVALAERHLGRKLRLRAAGPLLLPLLAPFVPELRALRPMLGAYLRPLAFDGTRLRRLLGEPRLTPYDVAIPRTLDWLRARGPG